MEYFPRYMYGAARVSTDNTLSIPIENSSFSNKPDRDFVCPLTKSILELRHCKSCVPFNEWATTFLITSPFLAFAIPPPIIFAKNNTSYFNNFLNKFRAISGKEYVIESDILYQALMRSYYDFVNESSFRGGFLLKQLSGKNSFYKLYCLGGNGNCIRGTLIVCPDLMPGEVSVPPNVYNELISKKVKYVILNRDPSINTRCLYVCEYKQHTDSPTVKVSQFVLKGLHGDQDGDEVNLYYITGSDIDTYNTRLAHYEQMRGTWAHGFRHDVLGHSRYTFSQQHDLMLYKYDKELSKHNAFWKSLDRYVGQKKRDVFWDLASFTYREEADGFLRYLLKFCRITDPGLATLYDLRRGVGIMEEIVASGAKGTNMHIEEFQRLLGGQEINALMADSMKSFDKFVQSNYEMKVCGRQQSGSNHIYQNVYLTNRTLYSQDVAIVDDIFESALSSLILFRPAVVRHEIYQFISNLKDNDVNQVV